MCVVLCTTKIPGLYNKLSQDEKNAVFHYKRQEIQNLSCYFLAFNSSAGLEEQRTVISKYIQWLKRHQFPYQIHCIIAKNKKILFPFKYGEAK